MLTLDTVVGVMPANLKKSVTQAFVDQINNLCADPDTAEAIRENFISYTKVLQEGKFKTQDYLYAVTYVSFKVMGYSNKEAYSRTFPQRYADMVARGLPSKDIAAHISMYNKGKLVNLILEQTLVPTWVLNQDAYQKAINTQVQLMRTSPSDLVRCQAANSILTHLQKPKEVGPLVNINMGESSGLRELEGMLTELAQQQKALIQGGISTKQIAEQKIVDAEVVE